MCCISLLIELENDKDNLYHQLFVINICNVAIVSLRSSFQYNSSEYQTKFKHKPKLMTSFFPLLERLYFTSPKLVNNCGFLPFFFCIFVY